MKRRIQFLFELSFITAILLFGVNAYCQVVEFTITQQGDMGGYNGYYRTMTVNDSLLQTDFEFNEGEYVRVYAYRMAWDSDFHVLPESTYLARTNNLHIGDTWHSWVFEPVTAQVTDTITIDLPLGDFFTYKTVFTNSAGDTNFIAWGSLNIGGIQMHMQNYDGDLVGYSIAGGQGYWPLAVGNFWRYDIATDINYQHPSLPEILSLFQNYPNPFNAQTTVMYVLPEESSVSVDIYDILGRKIETLISEKQNAGEHSIIWNANGVTSGIYFYQVKAGNYTDTKKCLLVK